jgi:hypothetical protein
MRVVSLYNFYKTICAHRQDGCMAKVSRAGCTVPLQPRRGESSTKQSLRDVPSRLSNPCELYVCTVSTTPSGIVEEIADTSNRTTKHRRNEYSESNQIKANFSHLFQPRLFLNSINTDGLPLTLKHLRLLLFKDSLLPSIYL